MNAEQLLSNILGVLSTVRDDAEKLQKINDFLMNEIYEEPQPEEITEKYRKVVHNIAENINCGLVCFLNPETFELEDVPKELLYDPEEFELATGETWDDTFKHENWERCITVETREGKEAFKIMEWFVDEIDDKKFANQLTGILNRKRPFANFKEHVESSEYRQQWFDFKQKMLEQMVWEEISWQLESSDTDND